MQERIFSMLLQENEVTWQSILYDLVRREEMDPWDINIGELTHKYIEMLNSLKNLDFRISGKVLLAATILLKLKSKKFIDSDITEFNKLMTMSEEEDDYLYDEEIPFEDIDYAKAVQSTRPDLVPRTPQPRSRKVSLFDLVDALNKALDVKDRRVLNRDTHPEVKIPEKKTDISMIIKQVHNRITTYFKKNDKLSFSQLIPSNAKEDVVLTFIPLLHLSNMRKVRLNQEEHFGDFDISLIKGRKTAAAE